MFVIGTMGWALGFFGAHTCCSVSWPWTGGPDQAEPQSLDVVAVPGLLAELFAGTVRAASARRSRDHRTGRGARVFPGGEHYFPAIIGGLLLTAVIAAVMSTADSQLLLSSAIAAGDRRCCGGSPVHSVRSRRVWLGRGLLILIGTLAAFLAIAFPDTVLNLVAYAWGGMARPLPAVLLSLYWRRFNVGGALAGSWSDLWSPRSGNSCWRAVPRECSM